MARTFLNLSSDFRTQAGRTVHGAGMVLAALQLGWALWLAVRWGETFGPMVMLSGFFYATGTYLLSRLFRRIIDRRALRRPAGSAL